MDQKTKRESGIELLRILAICGIIILHINDGRALVDCREGSLNYYILMLLESIFICGVDVFILISGYFLCTTSKRYLIKPVMLIIQVIVFVQINYLVRVLLGQTHFSVVTFFAHMIPRNYFVILYIVLYLLSPYINIVFAQLEKKQLDTLLITLIMLFSLWNTTINLIEDVSHRSLWGASTVGAYGSQSGMNIVNFILLYCIGAYLRLKGFPSFLKTKTSAILCWLVCVTGIFLWAILIKGGGLSQMRSAWAYYNPLVIASSVFLLYYFVSIHFHSSAINTLSKAVFTCFLFHVKVMDIFYCQRFVVNSPLVLVLYLISVVIAIYILSFLIDKVYSFIISPLQNFLKRFNILSCPFFE